MPELTMDALANTVLSQALEIAELRTERGQLRDTLDGVDGRLAQLTTRLAELEGTAEAKGIAADITAAKPPLTGAASAAQTAAAPPGRIRRRGTR